MPRGFTAQEREIITRKLKDAGRRSFERYGIRRTNIADLTRPAGIAKGSFYLFFRSKEDLYFEVLEEVQNEMRGPLEEALAAPGANPPAVLRRYLNAALTAFETNAILRALTEPGELEALMRKVPPEKLARHREEDLSYLRVLIERWQEQGIVIPGDPEVLVGLFTAMALAALHRDFVGPRIFSDVMTLLTRLVCDGLFRSEKEPSS